ncbi:MAG: NADH:ubiquinone reductase (Na(+)-transporting) subunit C [Paramuribaculum sp.]|nr:NADH:ubiquinone reductase (Na(+)-transporting) subunit C [Paramuribaculum sp.]
MNKQSNTYTVIYIIGLILVVGTALAGTALALQSRQQQNADADKMRQILAAAHISAGDKDVIKTFDSHIINQMVLNQEGDSIGADAFSVDMAAQVKLPEGERQLPLFVCQVNDAVKYIIPLYGAGLWGPIWGYIAIDADGSHIYGAYFAHQSETPGLGAEIEKPKFSDQFNGSLTLFKNGEFMPIAVVKQGMKPAGNEDYVDGISGGTITSKGLSDMLANCLAPYKSYLQKISTK